MFVKYQMNSNRYLKDLTNKLYCYDYNHRALHVSAIKLTRRLFNHEQLYDLTTFQPQIFFKELLPLNITSPSQQIHHKHRSISPWHHIPVFPHLGHSVSKHYIIDNVDKNDYSLNCADFQLSILNSENLFSNDSILNYPLKQSIHHSTMKDAIYDAVCTSHNNLVVHMIVEIPKGTQEKFEIHTTQIGNPIQQEYKENGTLRYYHEPFPWNYGAIPQTWEHPLSHTGFPFPGDNDPIDIIEISQKSFKRGDIVSVKVLGCLGLIDQEELDWKIIGIESDSLVEKNMCLPMSKDEINSIIHWLRTYKVADGKSENAFLYNGNLLSPNIAALIISHGHYAWRQLIQHRTQKSNPFLWIPLLHKN